MGEWETNTEFWFWNLWKSSYLEVQEESGKIILNWVLGCQDMKWTEVALDYIQSYFFHQIKKCIFKLRIWQPSLFLLQLNVLGQSNGENEKSI
jgi:hypothetical protein